MSDEVRAVIDKLVEALGGEEARSVLNEAGVLVLMPMKATQVPKGAKVHIRPPAISTNWPESIERRYGQSQSVVFVNVLESAKQAPESEPESLEWVELRRFDDDGNEEVLRIRKGQRTLDEVRES
jgi:hypothetical protein